MKLYTSARSRGLRCTWTVTELGVEDQVELHMLPFPPRAFAKHYFAVNPLGTIPALVDGETTMTESSASRFSPEGLAVAPHETDYGAFLDFLHHADATLTFPQTVAMRFCLFETDKGLQAAGEAYGDWFGKRLAKINQRLQNRDYLCADRFTVADIAISYALYLARMMARPGFARAEAWEDEMGTAQGVPNRIS
jgi:glutathione S-transferase